MMRFFVIVFGMLFLGSTDFAVAQERCGVENCHGIDVVCGPNVPEACDMMYGLGDFCRAYANCEVVEGDCRLVKNATFAACSECVRECMDTYPNDPVESFNCEAQCREKIINALDPDHSLDENLDESFEEAGSSEPGFAGEEPIAE